MQLLNYGPVPINFTLKDYIYSLDNLNDIVDTFMLNYLQNTLSDIMLYIHLSIKNILKCNYNNYSFLLQNKLNR